MVCDSVESQKGFVLNKLSGSCRWGNGMIKSVLKTIAVAALGLSASGAFATSISQIGASANIGESILVQADLGAAGPSPFNFEAMTGFTLFMTLPIELAVQSVSDGSFAVYNPVGALVNPAPSAALEGTAIPSTLSALSSLTDSVAHGASIRGTVFPQASAQAPSTTNDVFWTLGIAGQPSVADEFSIDILNFIFASVATPGDFSVSYFGNYSRDIATAGGGTASEIVAFGSAQNQLSFDIKVVDPNAAVIPLPAGGVLMLTAAGAFALMRRRKT